MPGELLNEQLQILFPICDEIGIIIQQEGLNIDTIRNFVDSKITGAYYTEGEIYIKNEYGRSIITYSSWALLHYKLNLVTIAVMAKPSI